MRMVWTERKPTKKFVTRKDKSLGDFKNLSGFLFFQNTEEEIYELV
jgi:hypothetical protein